MISQISGQILKSFCWFPWVVFTEDTVVLCRNWRKNSTSVKTTTQGIHTCSFALVLLPHSHNRFSLKPMSYSLHFPQKVMFLRVLLKILLASWTIRKNCIIDIQYTWLPQFLNFIWNQINLQSSIKHKPWQKELFNSQVWNKHNTSLPYSSFSINPFFRFKHFPLVNFKGRWMGLSSSKHSSFYNFTGHCPCQSQGTPQDRRAL